MNTLRINLFFALFVFFFSLYGFILVPAAVAGTQYVSDLLIISIREGQDPDTPIIGYLQSAASVEVLEETEEWMRIRTEDGTQGWVRKKFIVKDKPKAVIIRELEKKIALLEDDIKTLQKGSDSQGLMNTVKEYKQQIAALATSLENEKKTTLTLQKKLQRVNATYQALVNKQKNAAGTIKELAAIKDENQALKDKIAALPPIDSTPMLPGNMKWFLIGGGVLLLGFLIGRAIRGGKRAYRY
ncbi:TIGR04211 family SH3 domain-containing protein [Thermodesulfobacteriota bacterium]